MSELKLKNCPFCGGRASQPASTSPSDERCGYNFVAYVECSACGVSTRTESNHDKGGWCNESIESAKARAVKKWNSRTQPEATKPAQADERCPIVHGGSVEVAHLIAIAKATGLFGMASITDIKNYSIALLNEFAVPPAQDLGVVETHGAAAQPVGEITGISKHDGQATIGLYDLVVGVGDLVYAVPQSASDTALDVARKALEKISTWSFGWDGDCGVRNVAEDALADIEAALASPADALVEGDRVDAEQINFSVYDDPRFKKLTDALYMIGFHQAGSGDREVKALADYVDARNCQSIKDAERWRFRQKFLLDGGAVLWSQRGCQYRNAQGAIICQGGTEEEAIDAAIQAQKDGHG